MFLKSLRQVAAWAALATIAAFPAHALEKVEGKEYQPGTFQQGTWPYTVLSSSCEKPVYLKAGYLQGVSYPEGWYCADLSRLRIVPYEPRSTLDTK